MANVVSRSDFTVLLSVNTPDFPAVAWVINPTLLASLIGNGTPSAPQVPKVYWIIDPVGSHNLREMTPAEKSGVDLTVTKQTKKLALHDSALGFIESRYPLQKQVILLQRAVNGPTPELNAYFGWVEGIMASLTQKYAQINAATTVEGIDAVFFDPNAYIPTDPLVDIDGTAAGPI